MGTHDDLNPRINSEENEVEDELIKKFKKAYGEGYVEESSATTTTAGPPQISFANRPGRTKTGIGVDGESRVRLEILKAIWSNPSMTNTYSFDQLNKLSEQVADDFIQKNYLI